MDIPLAVIGFLFTFEMLYGEAKFKTHDYTKKSQKSGLFVPPITLHFKIAL
jgi:hypothetical protein